MHIITGHAVASFCCTAPHRQIEPCLCYGVNTFVTLRFASTTMILESTPVSGLDWNWNVCGRGARDEFQGLRVDSDSSSSVDPSRSWPDRDVRGRPKAAAGFPYICFHPVHRTTITGTARHTTTTSSGCPSQAEMPSRRHSVPKLNKSKRNGAPHHFATLDVLFSAIVFACARAVTACGGIWTGRARGYYEERAR